MGLAIEHADSLYEATLTSFSTVAQGIGHINEESGFGIVAHNLSHASKPHFHDYVEITHVLSGTVMFWVEGETECVGEGGTMVIRPGVRHVISPVLQDAATCPLETDILVRFVKARTGKTLGRSSMRPDSAKHRHCCSSRTIRWLKSAKPWDSRAPAIFTNGFRSATV